METLNGPAQIQFTSYHSDIDAYHEGNYSANKSTVACESDVKRYLIEQTCLTTTSKSFSNTTGCYTRTDKPAKASKQSPALNQALTQLQCPCKAQMRWKTVSLMWMLPWPWNFQKYLTLDRIYKMHENYAFELKATVRRLPRAML